MIIPDRISEKIEKTDSCWIWKAYKHKGYGRLNIKGQVITASRLIWELSNGPIPPGMFMLHKCDNPPCVNPDHLFLGTHQDNATDRDNKNRHRALKGVEHPRHKLSESDVINIRMLDIPRKQLAKLYQMHLSTIDRIKTNRGWQHLP